MTRAHVIVRGVVQGVGYRATTVREAERLGVRGWVRNRTDGSVEFVAEGERARLDQLIEWARRGPGGSVVDDVQVEWSEPQSPQSPQSIDEGFRIRR